LEERIKQLSNNTPFVEITPRKASKTREQLRDFDEMKISGKDDFDGLNKSENSLTLKPIKILKVHG
jgi:hypothetical protein